MTLGSTSDKLPSMKISDAYLSIARVAYKAANEMPTGPDRDNIVWIAVEAEGKFVDLRDEGR